MKKSLYLVCSAALLGAALASCGGSKQTSDTASTSTPAPQAAAPADTTKAAPAAEAPLARGKAASVKVTLSVESVDQEKRLITLKGPQGNVGVYEVGPEVKRLAEIKAGDKIHAQYEVAAVAELREPTAEEKSSPLVEVTTDAKGEPEAPPAAGMGRAVKAVTTIDAMDKTAQTLTVKDPVEGLVTVHVEDPAVFDKLKIGQTIIVTFAETLALAVEKGAK
jgi:hypothetical protein